MAEAIKIVLPPPVGRAIKRRPECAAKDLSREELAALSPYVADLIRRIDAEDSEVEPTPAPEKIAPIDSRSHWRDEEDEHGLTKIERLFVDEFQKGGTQKEIASRVGRSQGWVSCALWKKHVRDELTRLGAGDRLPVRPDIQTVEPQAQPETVPSPPPPPSSEPAPDPEDDLVAKLASGGFDHLHGLTEKQEHIILLRAVGASGAGGIHESDLVAILDWITGRHAVERIAVDLAVSGEAAMSWKDGAPAFISADYVKDKKAPDQLPKAQPCFTSAEILYVLRLLRAMKATA